MRIRVTNSQAFIDEIGSDEEYKFISNALTYSSESYSPFRKRMVRTYSSLLNVRDNSCPVGIVHTLRTLAKENGYNVTLVNNRSRPGGPPRLEVFDELMRSPRDFQREGATVALKQGIGIIKASTGSGKTQLIVMIMAAKPDTNWVVFVPKDTLAKAVADEYSFLLQEKCGMIIKGVWNPQRVTVVTFSQCRAKRDAITPILQAAGGVIVDECHGGSAVTHYDIIQACNNAFYRVGLSATPLDRTDQKTLLAIAALGPLIYEISSPELLELGIIAKPDIRIVHYEQDADFPPARNLVEPTAIYRARVVNNKARNKLLIKLIELAPKPLFCFVGRNEQVDFIHDELCKLDYLTVAKAHQKVPPSKRNEIISKMKSGLCDVCVTSAVFQDGTNVPNLASVVVGTGYKAAIAVLQRVGRGARVTETKNSFEVWDIGDVGAWGEFHTEGRHKTYEREGFEVRIMSQAEVELIHAERTSVR